MSCASPPVPTTYSVMPLTGSGAERVERGVALIVVDVPVQHHVGMLGVQLLPPATPKLTHKSIRRPT